MDDNNIIDLGTRLRRHREHIERDGLDLDEERIRNLAFQASRLPTTLSRSEIAELGNALLMQVRRQSRIV